MRAAIQKMNAKELSAFLEWNDVVLKWYQADHVKTMVLNATLNVPENYGSILADEMGLGKSIQSLSVQAALEILDPNRPAALFVIPKATLDSDQWRKEALRNKRWDDESIFIYHGANRQKKFEDKQKQLGKFK